MASIIQPSFSGGEISPAVYGRVDLARYQTSLKTCRNMIVRATGGVANRAGLALVGECRLDAKTRLIPFIFNVTQAYALQFSNGKMRVVMNGGQVLATDPPATITATTNATPVVVTTAAPHNYNNGDEVSIAGTGIAALDNKFWTVANKTSNTFELQGSTAPGATASTGSAARTRKAITNTTNATPVVVTSNAHGFSNGDEVFITGTGIGILDGRTWIVAGANPNDFQLSGSTAPGAASTTGIVGKVFELTTPYTEADLPAIKFAQLADVMTLTHTGYVPKQLTRTGHALWTLADFDYKEGPFQELNVDKTKALYTTDELINTTITITATNNIFNAGNVGQLIYIEQKDLGQPWEVGKSISKGDIRRADGKYYKALNSATTGTLRPTVSTPGDTDNDGAVTWQFLHSGYGIAKITAVADSTHATATILNRLPTPVVKVDPAKSISATASNPTNNIRVTCNSHGFADDDTILIEGVSSNVGANGIWSIDKIDANTFDLRDSKWANNSGAGGTARKGGTYKWALGAWGGDQGFPGAVAYHQQRQVFAATPTQAQKGWMSGTNAYNFFGKSTPIKNDDAVSFKLAGNQVNVIRHLAPLDKLIVLTQGSEQVISGGDNDAITPSAIFNKPQGYNGSADIAPVLIGDVLVMIQDKGRRIRDVGFQFSSDSYTGSDLSLLAAHLVKGKTIVAWAYQAEPFKCIWMVRSDGVLLALTYLREQQVLAWHRHDTDGFFEDVCVVPEGTEDAVYFVVRRVVNGVTRRFVERMRSRSFDDVRDAFFVDCGLTYDGRNAGATTMTLSGGTTWSYQSETFTLTASAAFFNAVLQPARAISATTNATPVVVTSNAHGYANGDVVFIAGTGIGALDNKSWSVAGATANTFALQNSTAPGSTSATGTVARVTPNEIHLTDNLGRTLRLTIIGYTSATAVAVRANRDVPAELRAAAVTAWALAKQNFSGLSHLEGKTVSILADGKEHPQRAVASGAIALDYAAAVVHAGLAITADLETLSLSAPSAETILNKQKAVASVDVVVEDTRGLTAGRDANHLLEYKARKDENYDEPVDLLTGLATVRIPSNWDKGGRVFIRQTAPLPLAILAVIPEVTLGGGGAAGQ